MKFNWGFTLLELLVALTVFAIMGVMAYSGLSTILAVRAQTDQQASELAQLQMAVTWLTNDIEQFVERPFRDDYGRVQFALQGTHSSLNLTHAGWRNPAQLARSTLQQVNYYLEQESLWRAYFRVLDRAQDTAPMPLELLSGVTELQFRFLDNQLQWHEEWPPSLEALPTASDSSMNQPKPSLRLIAVEVTLTVTHWGRILRLVRVPEIYSPLPTATNP